MLEGMSDLPTVLTSFETLDEAQQLSTSPADSRSSSSGLFLRHLDPRHHRRYKLGVERRDARRARLTGRFLRRNAVAARSCGSIRADDAPTYRNGRY